jgi:hypothetical protein
VTDLTTPAPEREPPRTSFVLLLGLRTGWLNALIVGATLLVWLTLIGSVIVGIAVGVEAARNDTPTVGTPTVEFPGDSGSNGNCAEGLVLNSKGYCVSP